MQNKDTIKKFIKADSFKRTYFSLLPKVCSDNVIPNINTETIIPNSELREPMQIEINAGTLNLFIDISKKVNLLK